MLNLNLNLIFDSIDWAFSGTWAKWRQSSLLVCLSFQREIQLWRVYDRGTGGMAIVIPNLFLKIFCFGGQWEECLLARKIGENCGCFKSSSSSIDRFPNSVSLSSHASGALKTSHYFSILAEHTTLSLSITAPIAAHFLHFLLARIFDKDFALTLSLCLERAHPQMRKIFSLRVVMACILNM